MNRRSEIGQQTGEEKRGESTVTTARISYGANGRLGHSVQNRRWEGVRSSWVLRLDDRQKSELVDELAYLSCNYPCAWYLGRFLIRGQYTA